MQQPSVKVGIVIIMTVAANISFKWGLPDPVPLFFEPTATKPGCEAPGPPPDPRNRRFPAGPKLMY
jgi:hypothetical protein